MRKWAKEMVGIIRSHMNWNTEETKRNVVMKVQTRKRGQIVWAGVGIAQGVKSYSGGTFGTTWVATKARWYESGWSPYPKGVPTGRKGKGWRKGLKSKGTKIYQIGYMDKSVSYHEKVLDHIYDAFKKARAKLGII